MNTLEINDIEFDDELDSGGEVLISFDEKYCWLSKLDAIQVISHLREVFGIYDQE